MDVLTVDSDFLHVFFIYVFSFMKVNINDLKVDIFLREFPHSAI